MVFKLAIETARIWRKLKGPKFVIYVLANRKFIGGKRAEEMAV
jgi:hypothetical protein